MKSITMIKATLRANSSNLWCSKGFSAAQYLYLQPLLRWNSGTTFGERRYPRISNNPSSVQDPGWPASTRKSRAYRPSHNRNMKADFTLAHDAETEGSNELESSRVDQRKDNQRDKVEMKGDYEFVNVRKSSDIFRYKDRDKARDRGIDYSRNRETGRSRDHYKQQRDISREEIGPDRAKWGEYDGDHLYGLSPVKAALLANRRQMTELLIQVGSNTSNKKDSSGAAFVLERALELGIPVRRFPKHDLNILSGNRPHQGYVLRASPLGPRRLENEVLDPKDFAGTQSGLRIKRFPVVLALDEVWDPMNLGALLRSAHFLGADSVVLCAKNSAPLSPTVSKASSGAMEVMNIQSVDNMMDFLDRCKEVGWRVLGTALSPTAVPMETMSVDGPTILVLGNEGHGIRTNILRRCTDVVKIVGANKAPGIAEEVAHSITDTQAESDINRERDLDDGGVDSLNVSVTGGILLHHIITKSSQL